jgi:hypothetical protein
MGFVISLKLDGEIFLIGTKLLPRITAHARPPAKSLAGNDFNLSSQPLNASRGGVRRTDNK